MGRRLAQITLINQNHKTFWTPVFAGVTALLRGRYGVLALEIYVHLRPIIFSSVAFNRVSASDSVGALKTRRR